MGADDFHVSVETGHPKTNTCEEGQAMFLVLKKFGGGLWPGEETVLGEFNNYSDALSFILKRPISEQAQCRIVEVRRTWGPRIEFEKDKQWES